MSELLKMTQSRPWKIEQNQIYEKPLSKYLGVYPQGWHHQSHPSYQIKNFSSDVFESFFFPLVLEAGWHPFPWFLNQFVQ